MAISGITDYTNTYAADRADGNSSLNGDSQAYLNSLKEKYPDVNITVADFRNGKQEDGNGFNRFGSTLRKTYARNFPLYRLFAHSHSSRVANSAQQPLPEPVMNVPSGENSFNERYAFSTSGFNRFAASNRPLPITRAAHSTAPDRSDSKTRSVRGMSAFRRVSPAASARKPS